MEVRVTLPVLGLWRPQGQEDKVTQAMLWLPPEQGLCGQGAGHHNELCFLAHGRGKAP